MTHSAKLKFLQTSTTEGFASKVISSDNDAKPSFIVRELIQNSLDAVEPIGNNVEVHFEFEKIPVSDIPGIEEYRDAFIAAKDTHKKNIPPTAEAIIQRINTGLNKTKIQVLKVIDNGTGLNSIRMNALLGDGLTNKIGENANSAGSYGLGHYTAFSASDLQYVIYGGVSNDNCRTMSGHAILASHYKNDIDHLFGKDGYFITNENKDIQNRFEFPKQENIPPIVNKILDQITERHGSGTVVLILAFNDFHDNDPVGTIFQAASRNFFPLINSGKLTVVANYFGENKVLTKHSALQYLASSKDDSQSRENVINGSRAYAICQTILNGKFKDFNCEEFGNFSIYFRPAEVNERTRVSIYRSGMFITDKIPILSNNIFSEYKRFNAVVLFDTPAQTQNSKGFDLLRQAEGEKHISIDKTRLPKEKRREFTKLMQTIRDEIKAMAIKDDPETHIPDDFMSFFPLEDNFNSIATKNRSDGTPYTRTFQIVPEDLPDKSNGPNPKPKPKPSPPNPNPNPPPRAARKKISCSTAARRNGNLIQILLKPDLDIVDAKLRLLIDHGADASCTNPLIDKSVGLKFAREPGGFTKELRISDLAKNQIYNFELKLKSGIPKDTVFKVDVFSRKVENHSNGKAP